MSLTHKRGVAFLSGDLRSVESLLAQLPADAVLERAGFESRARQLRDQLAYLQAQPDFTTATVEVVFGGEPVRGRDSIDAHFSAIALEAFQKAVVTAAGGDELGARGPLPEHLGRLHITDVVRGSFGFRLEEITDQAPLMPSTMHEAVEEVQNILRALTAEGADAFADAIAESTPRVVNAVTEFVGTLKQSGAVCRVIAGETEVALLTRAIVDRASERVTNLQVREIEERIPGQFLGLLPVGRRFEHRRENGDVIRGRVAKDVQDPGTLQQWMGRRCNVIARVTTVERPAEQPQLRYALLRIEP
jgi:hypothetical protein